jgi:cation:H+ antiporter
MSWIYFLVLSAIIVYSGRKLSHYGDEIADYTGLGGNWIGVILLASVTSLPELITGISAITLNDLPDMAAGGIFGSCVFNLLIIALLDILLRNIPVSARANQSHILSASFGCVMLAIGSVMIILSNQFPKLHFGWVGLDSIFYLLIYFVAMKLIFNQERKMIKPDDQIENHRQINFKKTIFFFSLNALVIIGASLFLPTVAEDIAIQTGLGNTFVGSLFIALTTSLPEMTISITALRMNAVDMAFGNIFGSNLFNLAIYGIEDIIYTKAPLMQVISPNHIFSILGAVIMTAIAIIGLIYRSTHKRFFIAWDAGSIMVVYILVTTILYFLR